MIETALTVPGFTYAQEMHSGQPATRRRLLPWSALGVEASTSHFQQRATRQLTAMERIGAAAGRTRVYSKALKRRSQFSLRASVELGQVRAAIRVCGPLRRGGARRAPPRGSSSQPGLRAS